MNYANRAQTSRLLASQLGSVDAQTWERVDKHLSLAFTVIVEGVFLLYCPTPVGNVESVTARLNILKHSGSVGTTHSDDRYYFLPHWQQ